MESGRQKYLLGTSTHVHQPPRSHPATLAQGPRSPRPPWGRASADTRRPRVSTCPAVSRSSEGFDGVAAASLTPHPLWAWELGSRGVALWQALGPAMWRGPGGTATLRSHPRRPAPGLQCLQLSPPGTPVILMEFTLSVTSRVSIMRPRSLQSLCKAGGGRRVWIDSWIFRAQDGAFSAGTVAAGT